MSRNIKLQIFYLAIKIYNVVFAFVFLDIIRHFLMKLAGYNVSFDSSIQNVRFFSFGKLSIGSNTIINSGCYLDNRRGITIGKNVVIAHNTKIYTLGHDINDCCFITKGKSVVLEDFVVVFSNVLIMPGVTIKRGAVVLPGSVVTKNVEEMVVVGGNPAVPIKMREQLHLDKKVVKYWFPL